MSFFNIIIKKDSEKKVERNFTEHEFFTKCADFKNDHHFLDSRLISAAQIVRDFVKAPVYITSSYRTPECNTKCGGTADSLHLSGLALDLTTSEIKLLNSGIFKRNSIYTSLRAVGINGFGLAESFLHIDVRSFGVIKDPFFPPYTLWYY